MSDGIMGKLDPEREKRWQMGVIITEYCLPMRYRSHAEMIMDWSGMAAER